MDQMAADKVKHPDPDRSDNPPQITAENCYKLLEEAKRGGSERDKQRLLDFMSDHYLQVLRSPAVFGRLTAAERELILTRRMEGRKVLAVAETSEVLDSSRPQSPQREDPAPRRVFCLHPDSQRWELLTVLPEEVPAKGSGMCTLYNYLRVRPLTQPRCQLRLVSMDGHLYAIGGECLFTVERYDPRADRWAHVAPLPRGSFAVAHEAVACGGALFVSGGSLFYRLLRYNSRRDEWEECPFNESRRRSADMVAHRSLIYRFDVERERAAVSVYRYNTLVKVWLGGARFPLDNPQPFRCAVLGDRIYCVSRGHALQFEVREEREGFLSEVLPGPAEARGSLVPFVLSLDKPQSDHMVKDVPFSLDPSTERRIVDMKVSEVTLEKRRGAMYLLPKHHRILAAGENVFCMRQKTTPKQQEGICTDSSADLEKIGFFTLSFNSPQRGGNCLSIRRILTSEADGLTVSSSVCELKLRLKKPIVSNNEVVDEPLDHFTQKAALTGNDQLLRPERTVDYSATCLHRESLHMIFFIFVQLNVLD
ncbi:hypothetical protein CCH79_00018506 [Gambusia affinis]|uniref:Kelch repeat and BTB domain-containing protein 11 n=1 Tax=Gambusia affinis TaxID=33528 RepID=A0A315UQW3_GAMAF|nr:hypothetical protein CCH79_00018506 [Gambusia affinis]